MKPETVLKSVLIAAAGVLVAGAIMNAFQGNAIADYAHEGFDHLG
ncbi:MAG: hypothetical protein AAFR28_15355 [Pseudomonadota bacterium]